MSQKTMLFERFELLKLLGEGSVSKVFLVRDTITSREVALKIFDVRAAGLFLKEFFERETGILSRVRHPNIVQLLDSGFVEPIAWIALEYAESGTLLDDRNRDRFRAENHVVRLLRKCTAALAHAHEEGVLHRDLKPANILFDKGQKPLLADFNVSKYARIHSLHTLRHHITTSYAAPEQLSDGRATEKSDVYSLGLIAAELLVRLPPNSRAVVRDRLSEIDGASSTRGVLSKMMHADPDRRPSSFALLQELDELLDDAQKLPVVECTMSERVPYLLSPFENSVTNESALALVRRDVDKNALIFADVRPSRDGGRTYVVIGKRYQHFITAGEESPTSLVLTGIVPIPSEARDYKRSAALKSGVQIRYVPHFTPAEPNSFSVLEDAHLQAITERQANEFHAAQERHNTRHWRTYLEVERDAQELRGQIGIIQEIRHRADRDLFELAIRRAAASKDDLEGHFVAVIQPNGIPYPFGSVSEDRGPTMLIRPLETISKKVEIQSGAALTLDMKRESESLRRQEHALDILERNASARGDLLQLLTQPHKIVKSVMRQFSPITPQLDDANKEAVANALGADSFFLIQGPPGTGKTTVIAELVLQIISREPGARILVTSQSNVAVDNVLERVSALRPETRAVRIGKIERMSEAARSFELAERAGAMGRDIKEQSKRAFNRLAAVEITSREELAGATTLLHKGATGDLDNFPAISAIHQREISLSARLSVATRLKALDPQRFLRIKQHLAEWVDAAEDLQDLDKHVLESAQLIAGTCLGFIGHPSARDLTYDWIVVDEAGRATAPELLVPLVRGRKFVLLGDHRQLPPIVDNEVAQEAARKAGVPKESFYCSLFQELFPVVPADNRTQLTVQYRMHPAIGGLIGACFYPEGLQHGVNAEQRDKASKVWGKPLRWLNTSGSQRRREQKRGYSFFNAFEAELVARELTRLNDAFKNSPNGPTVGILSGYAGQMSLLGNKLSAAAEYPNIKVQLLTVDAAQGKEFDFVVYSAVRSNEERTIGFLGDDRRLNVALSRAREGLMIIGDIDFLTSARGPRGANPFHSVTTYFRSAATYCDIVEA